MPGARREHPANGDRAVVKAATEQSAARVELTAETRLGVLGDMDGNVLGLRGVPEPVLLHPSIPWVKYLLEATS